MPTSRDKVRHWLEYLRSSFWFLPSVMVLAAIALSLLLVEVDNRLDPLLRSRWPEFFSVGADGSRGMLSAIGGSMITVAGVTFSITIVTLSLASSQYSSRILRNFMRDRANQMVLGVFLAVYVYCLIVLRTIRAGEEEVVPSLAVLMGIALAIVGIGFLIFFIHHVSASIQASSIIAGAAQETMHAVEHLFPEPIGETNEDRSPTVPSPSDPLWQPVAARRGGYLQNVNAHELIAVAQRRDILVRVEISVGDFVVQGGTLASVYHSQPLTAEVIGEIRGPFVIGMQRSIEQDAAFGIRQIVDIALKALSPGINDTTTADFCIDHLTNILSLLAQRSIESPYRFADGRLRAIVRGPTFVSLLDDAFEQIRQNAGGNVRILNHLLHAIRTIAGFTRDQHRREALGHHVELIHDSIERTIPCQQDKDRSLKHCHEVRQTLENMHLHSLQQQPSAAAS